jgi:protein-disulfide isomerase
MRVLKPLLQEPYAKEDIAMRPFRCWFQVSRAMLSVLCLSVALLMATRVAAQETVHQMLERLSPGQAKGAATAPVTIEEFSDFQCSYCGKFALETLPRLTEVYVNTGKVRFIFRHFAILGPDSAAAAEAAACAGAQGQFWPYHDRLFAAQGHLTFTRKNLLHVAQELPLDLAAFTACLDSGRFRSQVQAETNAAMVLGLRGTPGFVINGRTLVGALPFELFQSVIEEALGAAASAPTAAPPAGKPVP